MLEDRQTPIVVLRGDSSCKYPIGLTKPGDKVRVAIIIDTTSQDIHYAEWDNFKNYALDKELGTSSLVAKDSDLAES